MNNTDGKNEAPTPFLRLADAAQGYDGPRVKVRQRLRLQRAGLAVANYIVIGFYTLYLYLSGQLALQPLGMALAYVAVVVAYCIFFGLIATGRNLRFADPSLTQPQLMLGALFAIFLFAGSRTRFAQDLYFFSFLMALMFGAFRLNLKQLLVTELPAFGGFAAILIITHHRFGETFGQSIAHAAVYLALTVWMISFAAYISRLRLVLSARNRELRQAMGRIEELAVTDELTGAYNRRFIMGVIKREIERAERSGLPFSVCLLDLDNFKGVNDTYGHLVGDAILCELVKRVTGCIRNGDELKPFANMLSRFGGEEFLLALPMTDLEGAYACAERIRDMVRVSAFDTEAGNVEVRASLGVAQYRGRQDAIETLLGRVDAALYKAKANGRNRVEAAAVSA